MGDYKGARGEGLSKFSVVPQFEMYFTGLGGSN